MNIQFIANVIDEKLEEDDSYVVFTFYELRVKYNLTEELVDFQN